jgi:AmmeMemoRadiSam system protein B
VVILGADHTGSARCGEVYASGACGTPLGNVSIDEDLADALCQGGSVLRANPHAHTYEHSIEVQVPLLQTLAPQARIVPVMVPPEGVALEVGEVIANVLSGWGRPVAIVASSDLTHHGGHFPAPGGRGQTGALWTVGNDERLLDLLKEMAAEKILAEVGARGNACGGGAIAAAVAACRKLGATQGLCLGYTNSYYIVHAVAPDDPDDTTVGYASVVFC